MKWDAAQEYLDRRTPSELTERASALVEYLLLPEAFRREVCKGFDATMVARLLKARGHLHHESDRLTNKLRLPGMGLASCYHLKPSIMADDL